MFFHWAKGIKGRKFIDLGYFVFGEEKCNGFLVEFSLAPSRGAELHSPPPELWSREERRVNPPKVLLILKSDMMLWTEEGQI